MTGKAAVAFWVDQGAKNAHSHSPDSYRDKSFFNAEIPQKIPRITRRFRLDLTLVDNELQSRALRKSSNKKSGELVWFGAVLTLVGAFITVGMFTGFLPMGDSFLLGYGPFFGGLSMLLAGLAQRKK